MNHLAVDLGGRKSQISLRAPDGTVLNKGSWLTQKLRDLFKDLDPARVVVETCAEAFHVADEALACGHEVRVVPATLVRTLGVGRRGIKTDERDADTLSEVSCRIDLPSVHIRSEEARRLQSLLGMRDALVEVRTKLINSVRGWLRTQAILIPSGKSETFCQRVRRGFEPRDEPLPDFVQRQLVALEAINEQVQQADQQVEQLAEQHEVCRRLMTIPGVGPLVSLRFLATLDDFSRFKGGQDLASYLGLTPGENSSSTRKRRTSITKAGPAPLRSVLMQAAWVNWNCVPNGPLVRWGRGIQERRGKKVAVVAMARKLALIMYAMWRDGTTYNAGRVTTIPEVKQIPPVQVEQALARSRARIQHKPRGR